MAARGLSGLDHRQPDLSQRDALQGRRERGVGQRHHRQRIHESVGDRDRWPIDRARPSDTEPAKHRRLTIRARTHRQAKNETYKKLADAILVDSFEDAKKIDRLIWKYRAMVRIALSAADSQQYRSRRRACSRDRQRRIACRGHAAPGRIAVPARAQIRAEAAHGDLPGGGRSRRHRFTRTGLRGVLAGFLVDSLISTGRFDDARACVVIYPELSQRLVALGAVAEAARSARLGRGGSAMDRQRDSGTISARALPPRRDRRALDDRTESQQGDSRRAAAHAMSRLKSHADSSRRPRSACSQRRKLAMNTSARSGTREERGVTLLERANARVHDMKVRTEDK